MESFFFFYKNAINFYTVSSVLYYFFKGCFNVYVFRIFEKFGISIRKSLTFLLLIYIKMIWIKLKRIYQYLSSVFLVKISIKCIDNNEN